MKPRYKHPSMQKVYDGLLALASDPTSELYWKGIPRRGAGHRAAFWDGYFDIHPTPHVIPGTLSQACAAAGKEFRRQQRKAGAPAFVQCNDKVVR